MPKDGEEYDDEGKEDDDNDENKRKKNKIQKVLDWPVGIRWLSFGTRKRRNKTIAAVTNAGRPF